MSNAARKPSHATDLKRLLLECHPDFWTLLSEATAKAETFAELLPLSTLRRRALANGFTPLAPQPKIRLAMIGGYTFHPFHDLASHLLWFRGFSSELFVGHFDNYVAEAMEETSDLYAFRPEVIFLLPPGERIRHVGNLTDPEASIREEAARVGRELIDLCNLLNRRSGAEVILGNFIPPAHFDPGSFRTRTLASDWNFKRLVNLELGLKAPAHVQICDLDFLASRRGTLQSTDARAWYETKQPCSTELLVDMAREVAELVGRQRVGPKKVLVTDLDETLWGGVIGDAGLDGIEIGDTSARGQAFKAFQRYLLSLSQRGVLLAVCSKNSHERAFEPFERHPEMVLRPEHLVAFKANWNSKADNIAQIAQELNLGLDQFVFVDDNPAEIEIVRQFLPQVTAIHLGPDAADYVRQLQDSRLFEPKNITEEDLKRTGQYKAEAVRKEEMASVTDMGAYLESLAMVAEIQPFTVVDTPRISQLINKSNQFNLTTHRRTEAEVKQVIEDSSYLTFTIRLADRLVDHGLIAVVIGKISGSTLEIDTWLMSCRVLKRQVEELTLNELAARALKRGCQLIKGVYLPTEKNQLVEGLLPQMGFREVSSTKSRVDYELSLAAYTPKAVKIKPVRKE